MRSFTFQGASHYCRNFRPISNVSRDSLEDFNNRIPNNVRSIDEGTARFDEYRACALRDAERCLFLSSSHYRRALDLMIPSSSHWAQVTLYYGSWFAAHAILGMFGCRVFYKHVVEVDQSNPGSQKLTRQRIGNAQNQYRFTNRGSHKRFWEAFYATTPRFRHLADQKYAHLLSPIKSDAMWLINQRNRFNYNMPESINLRNSFVSSFSKRSFPNSLPGELNTQYSVCEGLLMIGLSFVSQFDLITDALNTKGSSTSILETVKRNVYWPVTPRLVGHTLGQQVFDI